MGAGAKGKVLIVDDEPTALKVLTAILEVDGFQVLQANSVESVQGNAPRINATVTACARVIFQMKFQLFLQRQFRQLGQVLIQIRNVRRRRSRRIIKQPLANPDSSLNRV